MATPTGVFRAHKVAVLNICGSSLLLCSMVSLLHFRNPCASCIPVKLESLSSLLWKACDEQNGMRQPVVRGGAWYLPLRLWLFLVCLAQRIFSVASWWQDLSWNLWVFLRHYTATHVLSQIQAHKTGFHFHICGIETASVHATCHTMHIPLLWSEMWNIGGILENLTLILCFWPFIFYFRPDIFTEWFKTHNTGALNVLQLDFVINTNERPSRLYWCPS